ncbi:MAG TPA: PPOX class F420-dependent oxidoreductase [Ilumatobacteraceae bacterium]|nr:PPOX class F420-dependent oxidoreductase [Ilumatobacteraceae bacterium]
MSYPASHLDLLQTPPVVALSTITPKGAIQTTAVWYLLDDDGELRVSLSDGRRKFHHLRANPTVNVFVVDPANPFRTLEIRGTAEIAPDSDGALRDKVGRKYGADLTAFDQPGETRWAITIRPDRVIPNG